MKNLPKVGSIIRSLTAGLAVLSCVPITQAAPYASGLTNKAGVISFRLNATTTTNDTVAVISGGVTNTIQPLGGPVLTRGLVSTNLGIDTNAVFQVQINHSGSGVISSNSPQIATSNVNIKGVVANRNPASPYFGWTYVSVGSVNPAGLFAYSADLADIMGLGATPRTGGFAFNVGTFAPYKLSIDPTNDSVLVCDGSATPNLVALSPQLTSYSYVLKPYTGTSVNPVGAANNHGEMAGGIIVGSGTNRVLFTMDESYQTDPTAGAVTEWNSVWRYNIGTNTLPYGNPPDAKVMTPYLNNFQGQNESIQIGTNGYVYSNQRRSNPGQYSIYISDLNNPIPPSSYPGQQGGYFWDTQTESLAEGYSDDVTRDVIQIALSPDNKWLAGFVAAGSGTIIAPDGSTFANAANDIILFPLTNGIPNLSARQVFRVGGFSNGRDIAFDAANNLIIGSSGLGAIQTYDIGQTATATTGSDGTFSLVTPSAVVTAVATTPVAFQAGPVPGVVTFTRSGDLTKSVKIFYTLSGTAKYGTNAGGGFIITTNATTATNFVIIPANAASATVSVVPTPAATPQLSLTAILTIKGSSDYAIGFPNSATISIADNHMPELHILSISTNLYQGNLNDYATVTFERFGDTNISLTINASDFAMGGTAVSNVDYYLTNLPITIPPGTIVQTVNLIAPGASGSTNVGQLSITVTNLADAGAGYTVSNNVATTTLTLQALPPATVLYSQNFESDDSANWNVIFGTLNNANTDFNINWNYDYTGASGTIGNLSSIPAAPHSTNGDTHGLYMTVNQNAGASSGLNAYLKGHNFSGNYAVRFDMFLVRNSSGSAQSQVEDALFGINHDGLHTNWFRNQVSGTDPLGKATASDGLFFDVGADGNGGGGANTDYGAWSSPTYTNTVNVIGPTNFFNRLASTTQQVFKKPPFNAGPTATGRNGGSLANTVLSTTPSWVSVEVSQVGTLISWRINNTLIYSFTNVPTTGGASIYTNGTIMLGFDDPWDDLANGSSGSGESSVVYDNLSVVSITPPTILTNPVTSIAGIGGTATFTVAASTITGVTNYQWQGNGVNIPNATNATYSFTPTAGTFATNYSVLVNDGDYTVSSTSATVVPTSATLITVNPVSKAAVVGSNPSFTVTATTSSGQTNYQWYFSNSSIAVVKGGTNRTLVVTNAQLTNFGPYFVTAYDGFNSPAVTSTVAQLTVALNPSVTSGVTSSNKVFALTIPTQVGPSYVVQFATNLLPTNTVWTSLITNAGTGANVIVTNTATNAARFYRVKMQ